VPPYENTPFVLQPNLNIRHDLFWLDDFLGQSSNGYTVLTCLFFIRADFKVLNLF